uniref:Uncharacterized protein n=1 Tax=Oryza sativa subsp. japonica TaxID=39947 RepID=Q5Z4X0_ORYSJ|nr:hypothetical protein [Oryza sativa Japonica Group]
MLMINVDAAFDIDSGSGAAMSVFDDCKLMWDGFGAISIEHRNRNSNQRRRQAVTLTASAFQLLSYEDNASKEEVTSSKNASIMFG